MLRQHDTWSPGAGRATKQAVRHDAGDHRLSTSAGSGHTDDPRLKALTAAVASRRISRYERWGKPIVDRLLSTVLIIVLLPVMLMVASVMLIVMGRPVLIGQTRAGRDGRPFAMLKFRTMLADRRATRTGYDGPERRLTHKTSDDPRHTPLGRWLRKLSLDELPQLFNVLRGQMSLVGPRPELFFMTSDYKPWQHDRHLVKPGLTGLWQTTERGKGLQLHECIDLDLEYISRLSFREDLKILLRTPLALLRTRGVI